MDLINGFGRASHPETGSDPPTGSSRKGVLHYVCGKPGHHAPQCRKRVKTGNSGNPPKANVVKGDDIIVFVVSQANMVANSKNWVVESSTTRHICANIDAFTSYTSIGADKNVVYLGDSHTAQVLGKGKVMLKLT